MENLNDVEFGSDDSGKEAPILVAQRYLNIFRQVHIFNKTKRDEFDNELLELPPEITDFFKRMPGGRLLVEHIEKVKTERGIAFVKSNKEDFAEGSGASDAPAQPQAVAGGMVVGGSLSLDPAFAETFAQALARAFKQLPTASSPVAGAAAPADFGNAFDVIAEEIRTSRAALLDVLKETRSITDSVIASQVSISRILEGILSSRNRDDADLSELNNRIIASQASITKLLEGLYTSNSKRNTEISDYLNVENRLQTFKNEIKSEIDASLQTMHAMFKDYAQTVSDKKIVIDTAPLLNAAAVASAQQAATKAVSTMREETSAKTAEITSEESVTEKSTPLEAAVSRESFTPQPSSEKTFTQPVAGTSISEESAFDILSDDDDDFSVLDDEDEAQTEVSPLHFEPVANLSGEPRKKKKRKKKKHLNLADGALPMSGNADSGSVVANAPLQRPSETTPAVRPDRDTAIPEPQRPMFVSEQIQPVQKVDGVIHNSAFKHHDDFDNINLDVPPLDEDLSEQITEDDSLESLSQPVEDVAPIVAPAPAVPVIEKENDISVSDAQNENMDDILADETLTDEDLDFSLPQESISRINDEADIPAGQDVLHQDFIPNQEEDDGLDFALPEEDSSSMAEDTPSEPLGFDILGESDAESESEMPIVEKDFDAPEAILPVSDEAPMEAEATAEHAAIPNPAEQNIEHIVLPHDDETIATETSDEEFGGLGSFLSQQDKTELAQEISADSSATPYVETSETAPTSHTTPALENKDEDNDVSGLEGLGSLDQFLAGTEEETSSADEEASSVSGSSIFSDILINTPAEEDTPAANATTISESESVPHDYQGTPSAHEPTPVQQQPISEEHEHQSRYSAELDRIRAALTSDSVDISSLDQPIALDDYDDDENVGKNDYDEESVLHATPQASTQQAPAEAETSPATSADGDSSDEDWEWEYVDENGNEIPAEGGDDEDWEWEYVEDDTPENKNDNNPQ